MEAEVLALKWNNHQSIFYHIISGLRTKVSLYDLYKIIKQCTVKKKLDTR